MDENLVRKRIRDLILDNNFRAYIRVPEEEKALLYVACVNPGEMDWIYEVKLIDKIVRYIACQDETNGMALAKEVKNALASFYDAHLEDMFDECVGHIDCNRYEEAGLKKLIDPVNGEVRWVR